MKDSTKRIPDPTRFEVSQGTLFLDQLMTWVIRIGGVGVIAAVFCIFFFIFIEILPLFRSADVDPRDDWALSSAATPSPEKIVVVGADEWAEMPFVYLGGDQVIFRNKESKQETAIKLPELSEVTVRSVHFDAVNKRVAIGAVDGRVGSFLISYDVAFEAENKRKLTPKVTFEKWLDAPASAGEVVSVSYGDSGSDRTVISERITEGSATVTIDKMAQKKTLMGTGKLEVTGTFDVTPELSAKPMLVRSSPNGTMALVACEDGKIDYFFTEGSDKPEKRQTFQPFANQQIAEMDFLFGGVSIVITAASGQQEVWSLLRPEGENVRVFARTKTFPALAAGEMTFAASQRNKAFFTVSNTSASLRYSTTEKVRWSGTLPFIPAAASFDGKSEHVILANAEGRVLMMELHDPHPEAGWQAFFGKVWYEGASKPEYTWQSTGGSDEFEPKLSQIPLIIGSLKGTFYALLFSLPIALLAAVFSANYLPASAKRILKPTMEIMASLPSVVLGFLAGLWLAPLIETKVPSILLACLAIPVTAALCGMIASRLPRTVRNRIEGGREWIVLLPLLAVAFFVAWQMGPVLEKLLFVYKDPSSGETIADFRLWWPQFTGLPYDQRNSMVVGFMMGFAVIPIIFTIAEDSLSNVPKSLTAASAALGASRWQVVRTIVLPIASPGIFSAIMIGLGRAVGETMIVVMASGNTPLTEWNMFNGMRPLSANIAVEMPEAAVHSTHYRTLFLGALLLFIFTFALNTIAEIFRDRLRNRFKLV
jgi:phosphate transport system permease protein